MANVFTNTITESTAVGVAAYTVPALTTSIILGLNIANKTTSQITASVEIGTGYVVKDVPIPAGTALSVLDGKIVMTAGQVVTLTTGADADADLIVSVMEQS